MLIAVGSLAVGTHRTLYTYGTVRAPSLGSVGPPHSCWAFVSRVARPHEPTAAADCGPIVGFAINSAHCLVALRSAFCPTLSSLCRRLIARFGHFSDAITPLHSATLRLIPFALLWRHKRAWMILRSGL
jgi:hypothetical protein